MARKELCADQSEFETYRNMLKSLCIELDRALAGVFLESDAARLNA